MENNEENAEVIELQIIEKLPKKSLQELLTYYVNSVNMETYVKIPFALIAVLFLGHNVFLAGRSFDMNTYDMIKNVELSIVVLIVIAIITIAIIAMNNTSKLKSELLKVSKRYTIKVEDVEEEFNILAVSLYGGRGVVLKK